MTSQGKCLGELYGQFLIRDGRLTDQQFTEIKEAFDLFDKNGDGHISCDEISSVMQSMGIKSSGSELEEMIRQVDEDGNGEIDFKEFVKMMADRFSEEMTQAQERDYRRAFAVFDKDGNGYIDASELKRVMTSLGEALTDTEINDMIREADGDGDGQVDFTEFVRIMTSRS